MVPLKAWAVPLPGGGGGGGDAVTTGLKDQAEVHNQLRQLLSRGVPLVEALDVTSQAVAPRCRPKVARMRDLVSAGSSFSDACRAVRLFDAVTISVYRAAERTGDLAGAAKQLSETARRQLAISGKAITLLIYPAIVLTISAAVSVFMLAFIVPKIGQALSQSGITLPWYTELMMTVGLFIRENPLWVLLGVVVVITALIMMRGAIVRVVSLAARRVPLLREVLMAQESARFFTVMAAMTRSGIPLADALGSAVGAISHPELKSQLTTLRSRLIDGGVLRTLIDNVVALPMPTRRLLIAAERSGDLESAFSTLSLDMTEELETRTQRLMGALEPLLIVFMFLIIGSIVLAIMVPLITATSQVV